MIFNRGKNKCRLAPFCDEYVENTFTWVRNAELRRDFMMRGAPTYEKHIQYFGRILSDPSQEVFGILVDGGHVGNCGLKNILAGEEGELWIYLGDESVRGKGVGTEATEQLMRYGFEKLRLNTLYLHVAEFNDRAVRLYKKLGFVEVPLCDASNWEGKEVKVLRMEMTREK